MFIFYGILNNIILAEEFLNIGLLFGCLPRPLEEEPGLMIQIFIVPSTIDSVRIFNIFSNVWLHSANNAADVLQCCECGAYNSRLHDY